MMKFMLRDYNRFIHWTLKPDGKKIPIDAKGHNINPHDPQNWLSIEQANSAINLNPSLKLGFVLNGDGVFCLDLDKCGDGQGGWTQEAQEIFALFPDALCEVSQSNRGLHIFGKCDPTKLVDRVNKWDGWKELYTDKRFIALNTLTGKEFGSGVDFTKTLVRLVPKRSNLKTLPPAIGIALESPSPLLEDEALIQKALESQGGLAAFGAKATFKHLWEGDAAELAKYFPAEGRDFDHSGADMALLSHLAFWTGRDHQRMDRLFRRSNLMRDKWERSDYRSHSIKKACESCRNTYTPGQATNGPIGADKLEQGHADMSHDSLANLIFEATMKGSMFYIPELDHWAECREGRWYLHGSRLGHVGRLRACLRAIPGQNDTAGAKRLGSKELVMAVNTLMTSNDGASKSIVDWDTDLQLLGTPTGIVDLRTGSFRQRERTDYLLCSTRFDPAPADSLASVWQAFLFRITGGNAEMVEFLQRLAGYAATGSTKEHKLFFAYGTGRNGKSTFIHTLCQIMGEDYAKIAPHTLLLDSKTERHPTELAHLKGARLARVSELPVNRTWNEALVKQLTGGDQVSARGMRQDPFAFTPQATLIVDANNVPSVRGIDEAFKRRMCLIPFDVTIGECEVDPDLGEKLMAEASAILRWIIVGAVKWNQDGLQIPAKIKLTTEQYLEDEDHFGDFLTTHFENDPRARVTNQDLNQNFAIFCQAQGITRWQPRTVGNEMTKRGYKRWKSNTARGYEGLRIKFPLSCSVNGLPPAT